jgi:hypothetical protein
MKQSEYTKRHARLSRAKTGVRHACWDLLEYHKMQPESAMYEAEYLISTVISDLESLVQLMDLEQLTDEYGAVRNVESLMVAMKKRRQLLKLQNVDGRTPEEAASYLAKAEEMAGG